jgi:PIN domain nuclease of toxin-antitoxin system
MNLLLDSHALIWWREEPQKLSPLALNEISNSTNSVFLSLASIWEIQIKITNLQISFNNNLFDVIADEQKINNFQLLPIKISHIIELENLPFHHKDPFDRIIIAQSNIEKMKLVSADHKFSAYDVDLLW